MSILRKKEGQKGDLKDIFLIYNFLKFLVFATLFILYGRMFFSKLDSWDTTYYVCISEHGYSSIQEYVFSPIYPFLIKLFDLPFPKSNFWIVLSGVIVTNLFGEGFVYLVYRYWGYKNTLIVAIFPIFVLYSTIPYSDSIFLFFLALFLTAGEVVSIISYCVSLGLFFNLAYTIPSLYFRYKNKLLIIIPLIAGFAILFFYWRYLGSPMSYFSLEKRYWGAQFETPIAQEESIMSSTFHYGLPSILYLVRNYLIEALFIAGTFIMYKKRLRNWKFLIFYTLSIEIPLLFIVGVPEFSLPRLILPAFPALFSYSAYLRNRLRVSIYIITCSVFTILFTAWQFISFFA